MVFRPEPTIYKLTFSEDTGLAGLLVRVKCCSIGEFNEMLRGSTDADVLEEDDTPLGDLEDPKERAAAFVKVRNLGRAAAAANEAAFAMFQKYLVEWDLGDEDGNLVPTTIEGILSVEKPVITTIIAAWHTAMMSVPLPLPKQSSDGRKSEEATLDLASLSESPQNWPSPSPS